MSMLSLVGRKLRTAARVYRQGGLPAMRKAARRAWWELKPTAKLAGCKFTLAGIADEQRLQFRVRRYEVQELAALQYLDPALPVVELGGCMGVISCVANRRLRHPEDHVVVEAN